MSDKQQPNAGFTSVDSELIILEEKDMTPGLPPGWSEKHRKLLEEKYGRKPPQAPAQDDSTTELG